MKKCPICGSDFSDDKMFCPNCGVKLTEVQTAPDNQSEGSKCMEEDEKSGKAELPKKQPDKTDLSIKNHQSERTEEAKQPEQPRTTRKPVIMMGIVAFAAVVIAIACAVQMNNYSDSLDYVRKELSDANRSLVQAKTETEQIQSELLQTQLDLEQTKNDFVEVKTELDKLGGLQEIYGYGSENYYAEQCVVVLHESESKEVTIYGNLGGTYRAKESGNGITWEWSREWEGQRTRATITGNSVGYYTINMSNDQSSDSFEILVIVTELSAEEELAQYIDELLKGIK